MKVSQLDELSQIKFRILPKFDFGRVSERVKNKGGTTDSFIRSTLYAVFSYVKVPLPSPWCNKHLQQIMI